MWRAGTDAKELPDGWRMHLCVYHARHPQVLRAMIEQQLDDSLRRHGAQTLRCMRRQFAKRWRAR